MDLLLIRTYAAICYAVFKLRAFVTDGSKGTGEAIVRRLASAGASIVTTARSSPVESDLPAHFVPADLATTEAAAKAANAVTDHLGGVDILCTILEVPAHPVEDSPRLQR
jgi:NAD(P)-dependent dehydrogenase (short-subunit alcohol dehydrogenase family)